MIRSRCGLLMLGAMVTACGPAPAEQAVVPPTDVVRVAGSDDGVFDREISPFLAEYYHDLEAFRDDRVTFEVSDGVVTVTGTVDSVEERDQLVAWVNAVPGVREVPSDQVTVGQ